MAEPPAWHGGGGAGNGGEELRTARAAYGKAGSLEEFRAESVQRRKAKERALARLQQLPGHSDQAMLALLAEALGTMARHVCSRADHHEAHEYEYTRELARVLLKVLVREVNTGSAA